MLLYTWFINYLCVILHCMYVYVHCVYVHKYYISMNHCWVLFSLCTIHFNELLFFNKSSSSVCSLYHCCTSPLDVCVHACVRVCVCVCVCVCYTVHTYVCTCSACVHMFCITLITGVQIFADNVCKDFTEKILAERKILLQFIAVIPFMHTFP